MKTEKKYCRIGKTTFDIGNVKKMDFELFKANYKSKDHEALYERITGEKRKTAKKKSE